MRVFNDDSEESVVREALRISVSKDTYHQCVFVRDTEQRRRMISLARDSMIGHIEEPLELISKNESALMFDNDSILSFIVASEGASGRMFHAIYVSDNIPKRVTRDILKYTEICDYKSKTDQCDSLDDRCLEITFDDLINGIYDDAKSK